MYSNKILNFQESTIILNAGTQKVWKLIVCTSYMHFNSCCSCSFEAEIIKIGQSSHKMYSNKILNFKESTIIFNADTQKVWKLIVCTSYMHFNSCCSCSFEAEIIKIGQSSHKMYSNKILNFQESTIILNVGTQKVWKLIECTT